MSGKLYFVSPDGALREGSENTKPRLPAFASNQARALEDTVNPFLVILNAEIAFRRFRRRPYPLCAEYTELIDLTIDLMDKIYFKPLVDDIEWNLNQLRLAYFTVMEGDVNMEGTGDEFGTGKVVDKDESIAQKAVGKKSRNGGMVKKSRTGGVVKKPGAGASHDDIIAYRQYLMSGCGRPFLFSISVDRVWLMPNRLDYDIDDEDDADDFDEDENGQPPELGLPTHLGGHGK